MRRLLQAPLRQSAVWTPMDLVTILIIVLLVMLVCGGGFFYRR